MNIVQDIYSLLKSLPKWRHLVQGRPEEASILIKKGNRKEHLSVLPPGKSSPTLIITYSHKATNVFRIKREASNLEWLRTNVPSLGKSVPPDSVYLTVRDHEFLISPYFSGRPMSVSMANPLVRYSPRKWNHLLDLAANWLLHFQRETLVPANSLDQFAHEQRMISPSDTELIHALENGTLLSAGQHGDYCPDNILMNNSVIHVVDWEWADLPGLPVIDLFNLALRSQMLRTQFGRHRGGLPSIEHAKEAFGKNSLEKRFVSRWLVFFQKELHLSKDLITLLFICFLRHTIKEKGDLNDILIPFKEEIVLD